MKTNILAIVGALMVFATPSFGNKSVSSVNGGQSGDHTSRFPRPDVGGTCDKIEKKVNKDKRLENPGSGHWPE